MEQSELEWTGVSWSELEWNGVKIDPNDGYGLTF